MSLHKFADMVSKQGRGEDSLLIHMTPDEVQRLQSFAEANGRSLTINPETGLPEAGMLSDLFKAVAPIALGAFLGPAGAAIGGGFMSAGMAGLATGGITALATGSLSRGLMAGLGAYGGAGLGESLMKAGTGALSQSVGAGLGEEAAQQAVASKLASATPMETLTAGFNSATATPAAMGTFAKSNLSNIGMAAAPIMAGAMVPTTTKMPENTNPAYIRQKLYDPYTQTYKSLAPVKASEFGSRSFSDAYTNPQTGIAATLDQRQPTPMAGGGIVALAAGGAPPTYQQYSNEEIGKYLTDNPNVDIAAATKQFNADPAAVNQYISGLTSGYTDPTATKGGSGTAGIYNQLTAQGVDPNELYAATIANDPNYATQGWSQADIAEQYNLHKGAYALSDQLKGNVADTDWARFMDANNYSVLDAARAFGLSTDEVQRRYNAARAGTGVNPDGYYGSGPATGVDYKGETVSIATPGDVITNPDLSRTTTPNIPGRPYGGFTGMEDVKSAYTAGGGSLGYTAQAPKTMAEFNEMYNKQTGDSLAAYDYLMGKGAGTADAAKYPVQSKAAATGINRPYFSEGMRYKPKFLSYGKDGEITSSTTSGKTADAKAAELTKAKTIEVTDSSGYNTETYTAVLQDDGTYLASNGKRYDVTGKLLAADGGMMGYAMGGGLGSLGSYSDGGRLLKGPGDGVSDSIPATIGKKQQPARLADGEFVIPARIVSELGNGSTDAGAKKLYAMMDRVQRARGKTTGKNKVAANSRSDKYLPA